jgi:outer membrane protein W
VRHARAAAIALWCLAALAVPAAAQTERKGRWEAAAGVAWVLGMDLGSSTATLEHPSGGPFELLKTETSIDGGPGAAVSLAWFATGRLAIEAAFSYARPGVSTRVTADAEDAAPVTSTLGLHQYVVEGGARWYFSRAPGRFQPFARAGAGYLRQLDADHAHVETGTLVHAGAGIDRLFRDRANVRIKRIGVRLDARVIGRSGGFDIEDAVRVSGAAGASIFFGF